MAKTEVDLQQPIELPYEFTNPNIRNCPCGCGPINRTEHYYIESRTTQEWYGELICLVESEGHRMHPSYDKIKVDDEWLSRKEFMKRYGVVEHAFID